MTKAKAKAKRETPTLDEFHKAHRGGSGRVLLAQGFEDEDLTVMGIFSSIETAHAFIEKCADHICWVISPYIVDDPEWGNRSTN